MSDGPISRPLEQSEISRLSGGDPYRFEMLYSQKNMERVITEMHSELKEISQWKIDHDKKDALEFQSVRNEIQQVRAQSTTVQSSVNDYNENKQQFKGAWKAITILFIVVSAISGLAGWLWDHVAALFGKGAA